MVKFRCALGVCGRCALLPLSNTLMTFRHLGMMTVKTQRLYVAVEALIFFILKDSTRVDYGEESLDKKTAHCTSESPCPSCSWSHGGKQVPAVKQPSWHWRYDLMEGDKLSNKAAPRIDVPWDDLGRMFPPKKVPT